MERQRDGPRRDVSLDRRRCDSEEVLPLNLVKFFPFPFDSLQYRILPEIGLKRRARLHIHLSIVIPWDNTLN